MQSNTSSVLSVFGLMFFFGSPNNQNTRCLDVWGQIHKALQVTIGYSDFCSVSLNLPDTLLGSSTFFVRGL